MRASAASEQEEQASEASELMRKIRISDYIETRGWCYSQQIPYCAGMLSFFAKERKEERREPFSPLRSLNPASFLGS
jgi:hypothetical protein